jgi:hypothetical protein
MFTLNETIKLITDVADGHSQIASRGVGDLAEWNPSERTYPLLWIVPVDSDTEDARLNRTFRIGCFDRVIVGEEGQDNEGHEQEVLSDMEMVLLDFVAYFVQQDQQDFFTARIANLTPATEQMDDRLAGYFLDLTISQDWTFNKCQIPATVGSPSADVDGITLYDFCDDSVFNRLTQTQKDCLTTALCGACDDATVINASTPTWSHDIPSGDSYRLPKATMLDSDGATTVLANYIPAADGFMFTATPCAAVPSLAIGIYSDAGHTTIITEADFGDTVYVKAVATNITATTYYLYKDNAVVACLPVTNGTGEFTYVVDLYGDIDFSVIAVDATTGVADSEPYTLAVAELFPPDIAGCEMWINADRLDTYTFNGANVSQQDDLSGNSNHISAPAASNEPLYLDTGLGLNGLRSVRYDGAEYQVATGVSLNTVTGSSVFIVVEFHASDSGGIISNGNSITDGTSYFNLQQNGMNVRTYAQSGSYSSSHAITIGTKYIIEVHRTTSQEEFIINGTTMHTRVIGTTGNKNNIYVNTGYNGQASTTIADIDIHNAVLTPTEKADIRTYLTDKWGI